MTPEQRAFWKSFVEDAEAWADSVRRFAAADLLEEIEDDDREQEIPLLRDLSKSVVVIARGIVDATEWIAAGVEAGAAAWWIDHGFPLTTASLWNSVGFDPREHAPMTHIECERRLLDPANPLDNPRFMEAVVEWQDENGKAHPAVPLLCGCEDGCDAPATRYDGGGVPVCRRCLDQSIYVPRYGNVCGRCNPELWSNLWEDEE